MSKPKTYNLDDLQLDASYLAHLMDVVADVLLECDFGPADDRRPHMDQLHALVMIGRDRARDLSQNVDDNYDAIGSTCLKREVRNAA